MASSSSTNTDNEIDTVLIFGLQIGVDWPTEPLLLPLVEKAFSLGDYLWWRRPLVEEAFSLGDYL